ncbi:hypothetical protein H9P43_008026 [Blastocladiella emersonii ATCC 22665]|nr:hypothetical protein H9P43_008010 [Blastocladiella emersonii ATCC 22665]KAI9168653.1 hypothetical protein H9P43_008026 [Blastocladiella emersonii ATCC 22665]
MKRSSRPTLGVLAALAAAAACALLLLAAAPPADAAPSWLGSLASLPSQWALRSRPTRADYSGQQLLRLTAAKREDVPRLHQLLLDLNADVWAVADGRIDVRAARPDLAEVAGRHVPLASAETLVRDIEADMLAPEAASRRAVRATVATATTPVRDLVSDPKTWFSEYHPFDEIVEWYTILAQRHPERVELVPNIGTTHEGRTLMALKITNRNSSVPLDRKKQIYVQGGIHAREWISHATTQYLTYHLVTSSAPRITALLDAAEWIIVPVVNPDGYAYTWESDRLWRKNRRSNGGGAYGVDLNRNYPANWGHGGSSKFPYSDTYMGPSEASEPEVQALTKFFLSHPRTVAGLDLHSYSQLILRPLGWERKDYAYEKEHKAVCDAMAKIIKKVHGKSYTSQKSIDLYATTGGASDYFALQQFPITPATAEGAPAKAKYVRPYGITIELRPTAEWWGPGFVLDKKEIIPTGEEILPAVLHYAENAVKNTLFE